MNDPKEVRFSCRHGKMIAGHVSFDRQPDDHVARSKETEDGLVMDYTDDGRLIGIEIPSPTSEAIDALLAMLKDLGCANPEREIEPLQKQIA